MTVRKLFLLISTKQEDKQRWYGVPQSCDGYVMFILCFIFSYLLLKQLEVKQTLRCNIKYVCSSGNHKLSFNKHSIMD